MRDFPFLGIITKCPVNCVPQLLWEHNLSSFSPGGIHLSSNCNVRLFVRLERVLVDLEYKNGVTHRWTTSCEEYKIARDDASDRSKKAALINLHAKVIERWFLLSLKAKYAGKIIHTLLHLMYL